MVATAGIKYLSDCVPADLAATEKRDNEELLLR